MSRSAKLGHDKAVTEAKSKKSKVSPTSAQPKNPQFPVVGIGASAGGLTAVMELLKSLSPNTGVAIVVIQHLDPRHGSLTADILSRVSLMPVDEVQDGMRIEPDHIYVIPPNRNLRLSNGILKLYPRIETRGPQLPIDFFFRSLADDKKDLAIGVVLSGIASDGTMGLRAIKSSGGVTFCQDPKTAQYDGMPRNAILSGAVDVVETPKGIAAEIGRIVQLLPGQPLSVVRKTPGGREGQLRHIFAALRSASGVDFASYKQSTIQRRIARRQFLLKLPDLQDYAQYVADNPDEVKTLFEELLIQVTSFFRDPEAFEYLKTHVLPKYMKDWDRSLPIRIWVPGCSSGEEVYSIAIAFLEVLGKAKDRPQLQIFASDVSEEAIKKARRGIYPENIAKDVSKVRLRRFFEKMEGGYQIAKTVRAACLFSKHDITNDPPFAKMDLISCRNLLIYLSTELQQRVVPIFHYALNPGGILWLGRSENIAQFSNLFAIEDRTNKFYSKKLIATPLKIGFPVGHQFDAASVPVPRTVLESTSTLEDVEREADRVALIQYAPPGVLINDAFEILQVRGRLLPYLELTPGQASLNVLKLARPEIVSDLRYLVHAAREQNKPIKKNDLFLQENGGKSFGIRVVPLRLPRAYKGRYFSIFFEEATDLTPAEIPTSKPGGKPVRKRKHTAAARQQAAQQQMAENRNYQQALIEAYETTQEELTSANEELQSTNEELQSTNEELETAKEELQSANEEMTTVNDELQNRNAEMTQLSNDLTNILASAAIPIVIVGQDGRIRSFTPKAGQIFKLIVGDIGRPIGDMNLSIKGVDLDECISAVTTTMAPKEVETQDGEGNWYRLQVKPYRTADNKIDGTVIALIDITALKQSAKELKRIGDDARMIMETTPIPILVIMQDRRVQAANQSFYETFQLEPSKTEGRFLSQLSGGQWSDASLLKMLEAVLNRDEQFSGFEMERDFPVVGHKCLLINARRTYLSGSETQVALFAIEDITVVKTLEAERQHILAREKEARLEAEKANRVKDEFLAILSHELRTPLTTILSWAQLLRFAKIDSEKINRGINVIEMSAQSQRQLIEDLLDVSRIQAGKLHLEFSTVDPADSISAAVESVRSLAEEKAIAIDMNLNASCGNIRADAGRLRQALWNLLTNAIKFTPVGGKITIRLNTIKEPSRESTQIRVEDTGIGIKAEVLPRLFTRFTQADSSATRGHGGLGLGLSIVRHMIEMHGGTVTAESPGEGKGSVFTVTLPREQSVRRLSETANNFEPPQTATQKSVDPAKLDGLRILVVDDMQETRDAFAIMLQSLGASVRTAVSAADGFSALTEFKPDVLLSDIAMPDEDGYSLIRRIRRLKRSQGGNTPAIAVTAYAAAEDVRRSLEAKFDVHVAKPVDIVALSHAVAKLAKKP